jgi:hypothetical protein
MVLEIIIILSCHLSSFYLPKPLPLFNAATTVIPNTDVIPAITASTFAPVDHLPSFSLIYSYLFFL